MANDDYNAKVRTLQGGDTLEIGNGGSVDVITGGQIKANGTQASHIADPSGGGTVDAEARTAINAILVALENAGITASS